MVSSHDSCFHEEAPNEPNLADKYDFTRPTGEAPVIPVTRHSLITAVLKSPDFTTTYAERAKVLGLGKR